MMDASSFKKGIEEKESLFKKILFNAVVKTFIVIIVFLVSLIYIRQSNNNKETFKKIVYTNNLSFAKVYNLYKKYLGDVIPFKNINAEENKLVSNEVLSYTNVKKEKDGYIFNVSKNLSVTSLTSGIVIKIENDKDYNTMVTIQDKNGLNITYGLISDLSISLYDYVDKNEIIGIAAENLYISFEKNGKYLSYEKYL